MTVPGVTCVASTCHCAAVRRRRRAAPPRKLTRLPRARSARAPIGRLLLHPRSDLQAWPSLSPTLARRGLSCRRLSQAGPDRRFYVRIKSRRRPSIVDRRGARKLRVSVLVPSHHSQVLTLPRAGADEEKKMRRPSSSRGRGPPRHGAGVRSCSKSTRRAREGRTRAGRCRRASPTSATFATVKHKKGAGATRGGASSGSSKTKSRGRPKAPDLHLDTSFTRSARTVCHDDRKPTRERLDLSINPSS